MVIERTLELLEWLDDNPKNRMAIVKRKNGLLYVSPTSFRADHISWAKGRKLNDLTNEEYLKLTDEVDIGTIVQIVSTADDKKFFEQLK